jgi:hypothetical protein
MVSQRSRALDIVIEDKVRVRGLNSLDARFAVTLPPALTTIDRIRSLRFMRGRSYFTTLQRNVIEFAEFLTTDPRDRIYALLSFSFEGLNRSLVPRYDITVEKVFESATWNLMNRDAELNSLHLAGIGWPRSLPNLPSWVPDYTQPGRRVFQSGGLMLLGRATTMPSFGVRGGFACWSLRVSELAAQPRRLPFGVGIRLRSIVVDSITKVLSPPDMKQGFLAAATSGSREDRSKLTHWFACLRTMFISSDSRRAPYPRPLSTKDPRSSLTKWKALIRALTARKLEEFVSRDMQLNQIRYGTMTGGIPGLVQESPNPLILEMEKLCMDLLCIHAGAGNDHVVKQYESDIIHRFCEDLDELSDWSIFQTERGFIGRGPRFVEIGDYVAAFKSVRTPFVLRKISLDLSRMNPLSLAPSPYQLVGEAYVEGMMSREAEFLAEDSWWGPSWICLV